MDTLWQDIRYAARTLMRSPGFTLIAVFTLALGIGANASIFSAVNGMLLSPLPYPQSEGLVKLYATNHSQGWDEVNVSPLDVRDWASESKLFEGMSLYDYESYNLTGANQPQRVQAVTVDAHFIPLLGVGPALGRGFRPEEDRPGGPHVLILTHGFWQRSLGGDPAVLGRTLTLDGEPYNVIGVMPPDFTLFYEPVDLLAPLAVDFAQEVRNHHYSEAIGRLKPGVSLQEAQAELDTIAHRLEQAYPDTHKGWGILTIGLFNHIFDDTLRTILLVMSLAVGFVLLIACVNVANLLLARAAHREREVAIRAALGAGRARLVRQLLTESVLLGLLGGAAGVLLALWGIAMLSTLPPPDAPRADQIQLDAPVLLYTLGLSLLTGIIFGLVPALHTSRSDLQGVLKEGGRSSAGAARHRWLKALVAGEVALALILLTAGGLMVRSFDLLLKADPGFNPRNLLTARVSLPEKKYPKAHQRASFYAEVLEKVRALPGVQSAAVVATLPFSGSNSWTHLRVEGRPVEEGKEEFVGFMVVSPGYFRTLGIPLVGGRVFGPQDTNEAPRVAVINQTMARRYWGEEDPVGKRFKAGNASADDPWTTVIGVVGDVRHRGFDFPVRPEMYEPHAQFSAGTLFVLARTSGDPLALAGPLRERVQAVDPEQAVYSLRSMKQVMDERLAGPRAGAQILGILAVVALVLAAVGIYGVISHSVNERTHEIGVRMALGAQPRDILGLVVRHGLVPVGLGLGLGLTGALASTRILTTLLYGISPTDPVTLGATALVLMLVAAAACVLPARRATRVEPMLALRCE